jgi:hypothetical protein
MKPGDQKNQELNTALAAELNKLIRKPDLYQAQRLKGIPISQATVALGAQKLTGTDLIRFNRALLLEVFAPGLGLAFNSERLSSGETRIVNRCLLEAVLGPALIGYQQRPSAVTFSQYLRTKLSVELEQAANGYDGMQAMAPADVQLLADGLNRLLTAPYFYQ